MSFLTIFTPILIVIVVLAFVFELMDASLGIGFGTAFTPILLIIGFDVSIVVPSVLASELVAGLVAMLFHTLLKNVRLGNKRVFKRRRRRRTKVYSLPNGEIVKAFSNPKLAADESAMEFEIEEEDEEIIVEDENDLVLEEHDEIEEIKLKNGSIGDRFRNLTTDTKVILLLSIFGILTSTLAAIINVVYADNAFFNLGVKIYIGIMVFSMGILILSLRNTKIKFSLKRIIALGAFGGFNKGISGGGYRPVTVAGQILAGREGRSALASTTFSKTAVSLFGVLSYIVSHISINKSVGEVITWDYLELTPFIMIGTVLAAPLGALVTRKIEGKWLKLLIGWGTISLGIFSVVRITLDYYHVWDIIPKVVF
ncbi:MAG: sulfite exporter TauE/SafE family protein [Candidatus Heimdallarchaeota archaeon]|nr:sulfite exporter TauE/SafE family protein [Candidatus Heimdallarchaeota archaeon]